MIEPHDSPLEGAPMSALSRKAPVPNASREVSREGTAGAFKIDAQHANGSIYQNVGDQTVNNTHRYDLIIEPMRRRARVLLRLGNALIVSGIAAALFVAGLFGSRIEEFVDSVRPAIDAQDPELLVLPPFGVLLAIPLGVVVAFAGLVLVLFGVSMGRRARREAELL